MIEIFSDNAHSWFKMTICNLKLGHGHWQIQSKILLLIKDGYQITVWIPIDRLNSFHFHFLQPVYFPDFGEGDPIVKHLWMAGWRSILADFLSVV